MLAVPVSIAVAQTATIPPAAPTNLTAITTSSYSVSLSWMDNSSNESGFRIEQSVDGAAWTQIGTVYVNATTFKKLNLRPSTAYFFRVRAYNYYGNSVYSQTASVTTPTDIPPAPSNLTAIPLSISTIRVTWQDNSTNETYFILERSRDNGATWPWRIYVKKDSTSFLNIDLTASSTFLYRIRAFGSSPYGSVFSEYSNTAPATTLPILTPANFSAEPLSFSKIKLTWNDMSDNERNFRIERATSTAGPYRTVAVTASNTIMWVNTGLVPNTAYYYRIRGINGISSSTPAGPISAITLTNVPIAPSNLAAMPLSPNRMQLTWNDNSDIETSHQIQRSTDGGVTWPTILSTAYSGTGTGTKLFTNIYLVPNTSYTYRVRAYNYYGGVFSVFSNQATALTPTSIAAASTYTLTASAGANGAISPSGSVSAGSGTNRTFTITPNAGYQVNSVLVDGVSVGAVGLYTFSNVITAHTISASFILSSDATAPSVNAFTIPITATSLTVTGISISASDNVGVTGYLLTESATTPSSMAAGWTASAPTSYAFTSAGTKTLYAWVRDLAGNVSLPKSASVAISVVIAAPTVTLVANPTSVTSGGSSNISWASTNAATCSVTKAGTAWQTGTYGTNVSSGALTANTTFTATCTGATGTTPASASVTVTVGTSGNIYYIRDGATGTTCADWTNSCDVLPATLTRGATYYIADGNYGSYVFDDPTNGTQLITIKKAIAADHGANTGWLSTYGDGQAMFGPIEFTSSNWVFDGQTRNESDWFDKTAYGFSIGSNDDWPSVSIAKYGVRTDNVALRYAYILAIVGDLPSTAARRFCISTNNNSGETINSTGHVFSRVFCDGGTQHWFVRNSEAPIIEYSASDRITGDSNHHGENINLYYNGDNSIIRYNKFRNSFMGQGSTPAGGGTAIMAIAWTGGHQIYGNTIYNYQAGNGVIGGGFPTNGNIKIYNNTFANNPYGAPGISLGGGTGNEVYNNLWINTAQTPDIAGATHNYNGSSGSASLGETNQQLNIPTSIFNNYAGNDFTLKTNTNTGISLPAPYNVDMLGRTRTTWSRGAYEY